MPLASPTLAITWPLTLEYYPWWQAGLAFVVLATPILLLGVRSLVGLGPVRRWVAIGARLLVLLILILILAGARWQRTNKDVEVIALRDISESTNLVHDYPGDTLQRSIEEYLVAASDAKRKQTTDRIGLIGFNEEALIDAPPSERLALDARALRPPGSGTDIAGAIQMALAAFKKDAMHRILLISDGRPTTGDTDAAVNAAVAQKVPIDVMPLNYDVNNEVIVERVVAPTWKRENEPFTLDVILLSTNTADVTGKLTVRHGADLMDLNPPNKQTVRQITVTPGRNVQHVYVPALSSSGPHQFYANFEPDVL